MKIEQRHWTRKGGWQKAASELGARADLVLAFGGKSVLADKAIFDALRGAYPEARIMGCSTAGEILGTHVFDDTLAVTAVHFDKTKIQHVHTTIGEGESSRDCGKRLAAKLPKEHLRHVFVLSDGIHVNGSDLVRGIGEEVPKNVQITGGLSGDGSRFQSTLVFDPTGAHEKIVAAIGLYGDGLTIGFGSLGGWDPFGPERVITRSDGNVLFELDGQPALSLYKQYLGEHASALPGSGLLFPLSVKAPDGTHEVVRTVLSVDEERQSMTFAGDMPKGDHARLMKANFDRLVEGAQGAATASVSHTNGSAPELAILISCVGRKMVLNQRTEEEIEAVRDVVGPDAALTGFYSYGEICPSAPNASCELHNQTMTITTFSER